MLTPLRPLTPRPPASHPDRVLASSARFAAAVVYALAPRQNSDRELRVVEWMQVPHRGLRLPTAPPYRGALRLRRRLDRPSGPGALAGERSRPLNA